tara:strand:+ start:845 stop:1072 length:228 start_codon:yes stop_codon:yes gene_type:complete
MFYNNWYETAETMDDMYDTLQEIVLPNISNILDEDYDYVEMKKNINDYCIDEHYNMVFTNFCKNCFIHEPQCICE